MNFENVLFENLDLVESGATRPAGIWTMFQMDELDVTEHEGSLFDRLGANRTFPFIPSLDGIVLAEFFSLK